MSKPIRSILVLGGLAGMLAATPLLAGEEQRVEETTKTTTTTTNSQGTVSQMGPNSIVIRESSSSTPTTYTQTKTTTYVDENGNPVSSETVKSGQNVTVYYDKEGDRMTATRVVVQKQTIKKQN